MKKLSLKPEELRVESFEPEGGLDRLRGTVAGHDQQTNGYTCICQSWHDETCQNPTCPITSCC